MPYAANNAIWVLSRMFKLAESWEMVPPGRNPCRHVSYFREKARERFLTPEEFRRLGAALKKMEAEGAMMPSAIAAVRLLMLTGCRCGEILSLKWDDVDRTTRVLRLRDAKTGPRMVPLTGPVLTVLDGIEREEGVPWVLRGARPGSRLASLSHHWQRIRTETGLGDVRIHDLRHSYASRALALGESLSVIGRLLGHTRDRHHRQIRPSGAGRREGGRHADRRQHRRPHHAGSRRGGLRRDTDDGPARDPFQPHRGGARSRARHGVLGPEPDRLRRPGLSVGRQGLHRPGEGTDGREAAQTRDDRPPRRAQRRGGPPAGGAHHRAHQGRRGAAAPAARRHGERRPHGGRPRGALPGGARGRAPEARLAEARGDSDPLPHPAGASAGCRSRRSSSATSSSSSRR